METPVVQNDSLEEAEYDPEFVAMVLESLEQVKRGETRVVNIDDL